MFRRGFEQAGALTFDQGVGGDPADLVAVAGNAHVAVHLGTLAPRGVASGGLGRAAQELAWIEQAQG